MTAVARRARPVVPASFDDVFDVPGSMRPMAVLRIALAPIVLVHLWPFLTMTADGVTYVDRFNEPWFPFQPELPGWSQVAMVWVGALAAIGMGLGWRTRWTAGLTTLCVAGNLFLSQTYFRHNRAFLVILLCGVTLAESGRVLSLDARRRRLADRPRTEMATLWPVWLLRALVASVYLASGLSKLVDPDWVSGLTNWDRTVRHAHLVSTRVPEPLAGWIVDVVSQRWVHTVSAPLLVAIEIFIGLGFWFGRTRLAAVWLAVLFHVGIQISASVEVFSLAAIVALVIWTTPTTRDRLVVLDPTTRLARWLPRLDWLARFDVDPRPGATLVVHDRDGSSCSGREALHMVRSRLPLTFFLAAPRQRFR